MYPQRQHQYPLMDTGNMYHQPLLQHHIVYPTNLPPTTTLPPPEPLPSATDVHTITLSISQLADFSATMVHLLWHERNSGNGGASSAFKKYCRSILQATQLSESVVLLSLKYICLLLRNNPQLRGAEGSEYRLYTVALMLANKFLDDNTFTNKTWSDISGMKMHELNMMEFEFLDVLQYLLFIQKTDFDQWKTTLFNFRNQLHDPSMTDDNLRELQQQQFIETTLKIKDAPVQYQQQGSQWTTTQQHQLHQQEVVIQYHQQQQQQQQQQQVVAAVVAQQQYNQHLYLLSKAQQPHIPPQQLNRPLTRVPLRIPVRPHYQTQDGQASLSSSATHTSTGYDSSMGSISATVIQPPSTIIPQIPQQTQSTYTSHQTFDHSRPLIDENLHVETYPAQNHYQHHHQHQQQLQQPPSSSSSSAQGIATNVSSHANFYSMDVYPQRRQTPQSSIHQQPINPMNNNGLTAFTTAPTSLHQASNQPTSIAPSTFYYNTPSATPISSHSYHHDHSQPSSNPPPPPLHHHHHRQSTDYINTNSNNNPHPPPHHQANYDSQPTYFLNPSHHHHHTMSTPTSYGEYKSFGTTMTPVINNDIYGRPIIGRMSSNPSYQHQNGPIGQNYQPSSTNQQQQPTVSPSKKRASMTKSTSGPVPEDPLTAAESYRIPSYD